MGYGLKIKLNNSELCNAGLDVDFYVVACIITALRKEDSEVDELSISVGGLNSATGSHVRWIEKGLMPDDKICFEFVQDGYNQPTQISRAPSEEEILAQKLKYFYRMKEELKGYLEE